MSVCRLRVHEAPSGSGAAPRETTLAHPAKEEAQLKEVNELRQQLRLAESRPLIGQLMDKARVYYSNSIDIV